MAINVKISSDKVDKAIDYTIKTGKIAKTLTKLGKRNSIMKMAAPGMYQYPILTTNGIEMSVNMAIAKAYQLTYAASVVTAYSLNPVMYLKDYKEPSDFVRKFHSNSSAAYFNIDAAQNALGITATQNTVGVESDTHMDIVDADVTNVAFDKGYTSEALEAMSISAWDDMSSRLDNTSLNDMYRPYDRTERIMNEKLNSLKKANEAITDMIDNIGRIVDDIDNVIDKPESKSDEGIHRPDGTNQMRNFNNAVVRNDKLEAMEPTMVNVEILCHGTNPRGIDGQFTQRLTLGIKAMPRVLQSNVMIASMVEACKDSHGIFKFMKLTKGEQKTIDFVLGISAAKKKALEKNAKMEIKLLKQAKKRKSLNLLRRALNNEYLPTVTVVMTTYEVARVKEICGVDLGELRNALKLMNKYFLLSFAIYDTEQNTLKALFDCDDDWSYVSVGSMNSMVNKVTDVMNQNEILKLFGRR